MSDQISKNILQNEKTLEPEVVNFINETRGILKGSDRRKHMATVVRLLGKGGQSHAERELRWDRTTIRKGERELQSGFDCIDNFQGRGRKRTEEHLPNIKNDIDR